MAVKKKWQDLSPRAKCGVMVGAAVQIGLQFAALRDLSRRTPAELNGARKAWVAASFINFAGPLAYFVWGRKK